MILVTGGSGFIGSHLVDRLLASRENVRVLVRRRGLFQNVPVEVFHGDLVRGEGLGPALRDVDTVIHLAGVTKALSATDYYDGNVRASDNLARAIAAERTACGRPIRMVHVSSLAAIGPTPDGTPLKEDAPPHPLTHYGKSKLESERAVRAILPEAVIVRPPVVYGPRDTDVFQLLKSISRGINVELAGDERWFSAIYAGDLADGIIAAARVPNAAGRAYFLSHAPAISWAEFGATAAAIMHREPQVIRVPLFAAYAAGYCAEGWARLTRKPGIVSREKVAEAECRYWICDTTRAADELGFTAPTSLADGLESALAWYRAAGWLKWN